MAPVTYYPDPTEKRQKSSHESLSDVIDLIRFDPEGFLRGYTEAYRAMPPVERKRSKISFPGMTAGGLFRPHFRWKTAAESHTGLMAFDFDHVDADMVWAEALGFPYTHAGYVTPSGEGYRLVVRVEVDGLTEFTQELLTDFLEYECAYGQAADLVEAYFDTKLDRSVRHINSLSLFGFDPTAMYNPDAPAIGVRLTTPEEHEEMSSKAMWWASDDENTPPEDQIQAVIDELMTSMDGFWEHYTVRGYCAFHGGSGRSFVFFPDRGNFYCNSCSESGDIYKLAKALELELPKQEFRMWHG